MEDSGKKKGKAKIKAGRATSGGGTVLHGGVEVVRAAWNQDAPKSATGFVGLKNLGCICYMNATLQNLFMCTEFRQRLLMFDDAEDDKKESVVYQLQRLFAYLQESEKMYYNPKGFTHAFKDPDNPGQPTNVLVQKDASGFLMGLLNQVNGFI